MRHLKIKGGMKRKRSLSPEPKPNSFTNASKIVKYEYYNIDLNNYTKISNQLGSNEGGLYESIDTKKKFYIKFPESEAHARNEVLAGKLYELANVKNISKTHLIKLTNGRFGIASEYIENLKVDKNALINGTIKGVNEGFVVDAWLANWDVVGLVYDNLLIKDSEAYRIDAGGALEFRALGGQKGLLFGNKVSEIISLRNPLMNPSSESVFKNVTKSDIQNGILEINKISETNLLDIINLYGYGSAEEKFNLYEKLINRRNYLNSMNL
jgi:hypothetical protein